MKKNRFTKYLIAMLALAMVLALPFDTCAAAKVVKTGKTVVTTAKRKSGYVIFVAPKTKTYSFTFSNIRKAGKSSSKNIIVTSASFRTDINGYLSTLSFRQNGTTSYSLYLCSAKSWSISRRYRKTKTTYTTPLKKRTAKIKMKAGQTIYIYLSNINNFKQSYDLNIK